MTFISGGLGCRIWAIYFVILHHPPVAPGPRLLKHACRCLVARLCERSARTKPFEPIARSAEPRFWIARRGCGCIWLGRARTIGSQWALRAGARRLEQGWRHLVARLCERSARSKPFEPIARSVKPRFWIVRRGWGCICLGRARTIRSHWALRAVARGGVAGAGVLGQRWCLGMMRVQPQGWGG